ncbi:GMC family oxidoreductase [Bordetella avium]|uniref:Dehydrogenase n=1 Tax=Bordetella avium (strain 197N) TaxID=360910 RepID=Q2L1L7_BORA1|nr:GMC family oxidoreductase N-terminal domain-containing protein [Bordetella avium]RIQ53841.1 choline dehydrogenase [Bordetella avium]RIQ74302.1 choline dehydrogenase [Bordetella avium]CAJ47717.1 putative dehydrogenase [Bordetella avium 197N]
MTASVGTNDLVFDYIIVGAGSAGCLLANRLSADPALRVLLIEAGGEDNWHWIHIPVGYLYCIGNPRTDWCYRTQADPGLNGRSLVYPRGRVLGGSSAINGMIYMRGQQADYDGWAALGNTGWAWDDVLPYFKSCEDHHAGASAFHGAGGEWRVERQRLSWDLLQAFRLAAAQTGIASVQDFNQGDNEGCDYFEVNQCRGVRWTAAKAFLHPVRRRPNLTVMTGARAERIVFEQRRAVGLQFLNDGGQRRLAQARVEVVLSAGAIGSAQLLQLSGVGPGVHLQSLGLPLVHDAPGVGGNLQDHLQLRLIYRVSNARTLNTMAGSWWGKAAMAAQYLWSRSGPLSMAPSQLGAFARSSAEQSRANVQYHVQPLSLDRFGEALHGFPAFTASVCNLRPTSRGRVRIVAADAQTPPEILCNYLSTEEDCQVAADSIRLTRRIVAQPALRAYQPQEYKPGIQAQSAEDLVNAAREIGTTIFHPVGTCRMGVDEAAVVDPQLRVKGVSGLRVIDASIMPLITSGNTNSPTIMIAEKGAALLRRAYP